VLTDMPITIVDPASKIAPVRITSVFHEKRIPVPIVQVKIDSVGQLRKERIPRVGVEVARPGIKSSDDVAPVVVDYSLHQRLVCKGSSVALLALRNLTDVIPYMTYTGCYHRVLGLREQNCSCRGLEACNRMQ